MNENLSVLRKKAMGLPLQPGVYFMKNKAGKVIYVGKAKKLKNRVSQYFGAGNQHTLKVKRMVENVADFDYIICDSEFEALILECSMIKQYSPKYNILLKDDKGYHYIRITKGEWPSIGEVKQKLNDGAEYLGPYNSGWILKQSVDEAKKIFKLAQCNKKFPCDRRTTRPCLNYHIGICSAPCSGKISAADYREAVHQAVQFIKEGGHTATAQLKKRMEQAAEQLDFETAAKLRDRIFAMERSAERQKVIISSYPEQDVIASSRTEKNQCFAVMNFRGGHLVDLRCYILPEPDDLVQDRTEFLQRYYANANTVPARIVLEGEILEPELTEQWLRQKAGKVVSLALPQKGDQEKLLKMCALNAAEHLAKYEHKGTQDTAALDELARLLGLKKPPEYIEGYDISNTMGSENVAGMTVFFNGRPLKKAYRRFRIKSFSGQDDFRSMAEVLDRRFLEYKACKAAGVAEGFGRLPDLILLDGGKGQLSAVEPVLKKHGLSVPLFGMVKDSKHKTRAVTAGGQDIAIKGNRSAYTLVSTIQEETHRFAITYHRNRSTKKGLTAELGEIAGVGPKRVKLLLKTFKTVTAIQTATVEQLTAAGLPAAVAQNVFNFYRKETL